ncbi:hypothetical protein ACJRO7_008435 [Eucalyptus globulus]|uniref:Profilin n=1 Tax=Eucalyptus globulus TaxID=34317 RepID=A0ABD3IRG8_EUCGL
MEWEAYYEDYLMFKKMCTRDEDPARATTVKQAAAIIGQDGNVWAQTTNFPKLTIEERIAIMREFDEPGMLTTIGLYLGGTKYVVIEVKPGDVIRAHKWPQGVTIKKTGAALVIGIYSNHATSNMCNVIVERVGDDLIKRGY